MGVWVYGCDRCQEACPRNQPWLKQPLPPNDDLEARAGDFDLRTLLSMSQAHYEERVWPQFFYISRGRIDRWQTNAARALGNLGDRGNVPLVASQLRSSPHQDVRAMCAWALGRLGGGSSRRALEAAAGEPSEVVLGEIREALSRC